MREYIIRRGDVTIDELAALFPERSVMTIRRDLDYFEANGLVIRTYGGAKLNPLAFKSHEDYYSIREVENAAAKAEIAKKAVGLLSGERAVYIDAGTTAMAFARALPDREIIIITPGVNIALELLSRKRPMSVTVAGGNLNPRSLSASGAQTVDSLRGINIDTAVMSTSGFSFENGFTNGIMQECEVKSAVIAKARRVIMLMDSSKLEKSLPYTFARLTDIHALVTDGALPLDAADRIKTEGINIY